MCLADHLNSKDDFVLQAQKLVGTSGASISQLLQSYHKLASGESWAFGSLQQNERRQGPDAA